MSTTTKPAPRDARAMPPKKRKRPRTLEQREGMAGYAMIAPTTLLLVIFHTWPIIQTIGYSFTDWNSGTDTVTEFVGIQNFSEIFTNAEFLKSLGNTALYVIVVVPLSIGLGVFLAAVLARPLRGRGVYRAMIFLPYISPMVGTALVFSYILSPLGGIANHILKFFGMAPIGFLNSEPWALISVMVFAIWQSVGYTMVISSAALTNVPATYYEAARLDGAGPIRQFFSVSLPLIKPTLGFLSVTGLIQALQVFTQVYVLTQGGPLQSTQTILYYIYKQGFVYFNGGLASAAAMVLVAIGSIVSIAQLRVLNRGDRIELT